MTNPGAGTTRLEYDEVDDATLIPSSARLEGDVLTVEGRVRAGWIGRPVAPGIGRRDVIPLVIRIAPVTSWRFVDLDRGTGELLAGEFRSDERGGRIRGVIPGDLLVESPSRPSAWFETSAADGAGRPAVARPDAPSPWSLTPARRAGIAFATVGLLGGLLAAFAFVALIAGLRDWDWNWNSPLTVYVGRDRTWALHHAEAWHYLLPVVILGAAGIASFFVGTLAAINPKRA